MATALPAPGLYKGGPGDDFVYEVNPDGGIVAYPTRTGIGPKQGAQDGWTPYTGDVNALPSLPNYADTITNYKPVATNYSPSKTPTTAEATAMFSENVGRAPYVNPAEVTPNGLAVKPNISGLTYNQSQSLQGGPVAVATKPPVPYSTVSLGNLSPVYNSAAMTGIPKSFLDLQSLFAENQKLQDEYLAALKPSQRELDTQTQLDEIQNAFRAGLTKIGGQTIAEPFIGLQKQKLEETVNLQAMPLQTQLQRLQEGRKMILEGLDARLGFAKEKVNLAKEMAFKLYDANQDVKDYVLDLAKAYPDSGITASDTVEAALDKVTKSPSFRLDQENQRSLIDTRNDKSSGGSGTFTDTQVNKGAAIAGIPLEDFKKLDADTQNVFINGGVDKMKKDIDDSLAGGENASDLEREISESNLPDAVKDTLVRYLKQKAAESGGGGSFIGNATGAVFDFFR